MTDLTPLLSSGGVSLLTTAGLLWSVVRYLAPSWIEQQVAQSRAVTALKGQVADAARVHTDLAALNSTLEAIAHNTEATHRATVQLGEKVGVLAERVAAVEAVQGVQADAGTVPARRGRRGRP